MALVAVPSTVNTIVLPLPHLLAKAGPQGMVAGRRLVYAEAAREGVIDREGEDISCDALWQARRGFLKQGNLDIAHYSWLGNPRGTGMRPEYVIGLPVEVRRRGKSIWLAGEVFSPLTPPPEGSNGWWADNFWHSLSQLRPAKRWFPSVLGRIPPNAVEMQVRGGKTVRFITGPMVWLSVGFADRAQHPALAAVSTDPVGPFAADEVLAKAAAGPRAMVSGSVAYFNLATFAKAVEAAQVVTAGDGRELAPKGNLKGVPAVRREAMDDVVHRVTPRQLYQRLEPKVLRAVITGQIEGTIPAVAREFRRLGAPARLARAFADRLALWVENTIDGGTA